MEFGRIRGIWGNFGKIWGNSVGFCMALNMNSVGTPGGFRGNASFSGENLGFGMASGELGPQKAFGANIGGSQKGGFQKGGFGGCSPGTKTGTRVRSPKPPFWKPPFYLPMTLFGVDKRVVSKRVVSADVPPERKPERGYVRQNHPFTKPPFYLPVKIASFLMDIRVGCPCEA